MVSSACDVLLSEPTRFLDYLLTDEKMREKIVDKKSFVAVLEKVLKADPTLSNLPVEISRKGESLELCGQNIFNETAVQNIIKRNVTSKRREFTKRVKQDRPTLTRTQVKKEVDRRVNIYISGSEKKVAQTKQVTLSEAMHPVRVKEYKRKGKVISGYRKTKYKPLTMQEKMLLENGIKKGKKPQDIANDYLQAGLGYRTSTSIKRHYYRVKSEMKP
jgi:hypothetical protein